MRLSDIDILGAIGDSDTAAFAARSTGIHTYFTGDLDIDVGNVGDVGDDDDEKDNDDNDNNADNDGAPSEALTHTYFTLEAHLNASQAKYEGLRYTVLMFYNFQIISGQVLFLGQMATGELHQPWPTY